MSAGGKSRDLPSRSLLSNMLFLHTLRSLSEILCCQPPAYRLGMRISALGV